MHVRSLTKTIEPTSRTRPRRVRAHTFRGPQGKPYINLAGGIGTEEISQVGLVGTTIARLRDGSPGYTGKATDPLDGRQRRPVQ